MLVNGKRLRIVVGVLGTLLPFIVLILSLVFGQNSPNPFPDSISATYYQDACITPFMIILGAAGILLLCYNGYEKIDDIVCSIAGLFGLGVCLFPCFNSALERVGTFQIPPNISGILHNICAFGFFALLAFNSLFLFTKSLGNMTRNKRIRNWIYRICGIGMLASFLGLIPVFIWDIYGGVWVVETIALFFFGVSWLTKADCFNFLFADKD